MVERQHYGLFIRGCWLLLRDSRPPANDRRPEAPESRHHWIAAVAAGGHSDRSCAVFQRRLLSVAIILIWPSVRHSVRLFRRPHTWFIMFVCDKMSDAQWRVQGGRIRRVEGENELWDWFQYKYYTSNGDIIETIAMGQKRFALAVIDNLLVFFMFDKPSLRGDFIVTQNSNAFDRQFAGLLQHLNSMIILTLWAPSRVQNLPRRECSPRACSRFDTFRFCFINCFKICRRSNVMTIAGARSDGVTKLQCFSVLRFYSNKFLAT